jgi:hypothetical protein
MIHLHESRWSNLKSETAYSSSTPVRLAISIMEEVHHFRKDSGPSEAYSYMPRSRHILLAEAEPCWGD